MRGGLSLAGALSIPLMVSGHAFPARDEVIFFVYCVVLGTLIVPSFTLKALLQRLGLGQSEQMREQEVTARIRMAHAALAQIEEIAEEHQIPEDVVARLRGIYELRLNRLESSREVGSPGKGAGHDGPGSHEVRQRLIDAQRRALDEIRSERAAGAQVLRRIEHDIDLEATRLRAGS
jgi:CPA1 family monovalent cation:H+ antiporter